MKKGSIHLSELKVTKDKSTIGGSGLEAMVAPLIGLKGNSATLLMKSSDVRMQVFVVKSIVLRIIPHLQT